MVYFQTQSQVVVKILPGSVMDIVMMETTMLIATLMEAIAVTIMLQIGITIAKFVSVLKVKQKGHPQVSISRTNISSVHLLFLIQKTSDFIQWFNFHASS